MEPRISVIMSVYNGMPYVTYAIESILGQTYRDFEFIIMDDGSTDDTPDVLKDFARQDKRIRLLHHPRSIGLTRALNETLRVARGVYIARQDADDVSLPERLARQVTFLDMHPEVGALGSAVEIIDEMGNPLSVKMAPMRHEQICAHLTINNCIYHTTLMARRSLVEDIGGYDPELPYAQDYDLWWRLGRRAKLAALADVLVRWRRNASITARHRRAQMEHAFRSSYRIVREALHLSVLDEDAYEVLWWALHRSEEHIRELTRRHLRALRPLWTGLAASQEAARIWGERLQTLAFQCVRRGKIGTGGQLLWIIKYRLGQPIRYREVMDYWIHRVQRKGKFGASLIP